MDGRCPYHDLGLLAKYMVLSDVGWGKGTKEEPVCLKGRWVGGEDREGCLGHWTAGVMPRAFRKAKDCGPLDHLSSNHCSGRGRSNPKK